MAQNDRRAFATARLEKYLALARARTRSSAGSSDDASSVCSVVTDDTEALCHIAFPTPRHVVAALQLEERARLQHSMERDQLQQSTEQQRVEQERKHRSFQQDHSVEVQTQEGFQVRSRTDYFQPSTSHGSAADSPSRPHAPIAPAPVGTTPLERPVSSDDSVGRLLRLLQRLQAFDHAPWPSDTSLTADTQSIISPERAPRGSAGHPIGYGSAAAHSSTQLTVGDLALPAEFPPAVFAPPPPLPQYMLPTHTPRPPDTTHAGPAYDRGPARSPPSTRSDASALRTHLGSIGSAPLPLPTTLSPAFPGHSSTVDTPPTTVRRTSLGPALDYSAINDAPPAEPSSPSRAQPRPQLSSTPRAQPQPQLSSTPRTQPQPQLSSTPRAQPSYTPQPALLISGVHHYASSSPQPSPAQRLPGPAPAPSRVQPPPALRWAAADAHITAVNSPPGPSMPPSPTPRGQHPTRTVPAHPHERLPAVVDAGPAPPGLSQHVLHELQQSQAHLQRAYALMSQVWPESRGSEPP